MIKQRKNSLLNKFALALPGAGIGLFAFASLAGAVAWFEPTNYPPTGNVAAPLNIGALAQGKLGGLSLGKAAPTAGQLLDVAGSGAITTLSTGFLATGGLNLTTGAGVGKVLTSDAAGTASWTNLGTTLINAFPKITDPITTPGVITIDSRGFVQQDATNISVPDDSYYMYDFLSNNTEFRTWLASVNTTGGGLNILPPRGTHNGNYIFSPSSATAAKLCEFFTGEQRLVYYAESYMMDLPRTSDGNTRALYWDPSLNKFRIYKPASFHDSEDIVMIQCAASNGIIRGNNFVKMGDYPSSHKYSDGSICDASYVC